MASTERTARTDHAELGWRGRDRTDPEVVALREHPFDESNEHRRVLPPVSKATGGLMPGIDLTRLSDIQEMEDLEYIERMRKGFK